MSSSEDRLSEKMRNGAEATWNACLAHRLFREVATDAIDDRVFARYLRIEYGFVDTASIALGYAVAKAPSFKERRRLAFGLYGVVTDQEQFFVDAFALIGLPAATLLDRSSEPLHSLFLSVAKSEGYEEILTCTLAAEWMYLTWCSNAEQSPSSRSYIRNWVALHAGGPFTEHVAWVRSEIDRRGPQLDEARQKRLLALFEETLAAEIAFHDAAYA
jgi:thiaminase/transcriptional activator TenA